MRWAGVVLALLILSAGIKTAQSKTTRKLVVEDSEIAPIHTALGYTTMLQFDARPTSAILGDQDAFKVEYIGNGVAIKPLLGSAKTNLFVFTDYDRFNFQLLTGGTSEADYLVRVSQRKPSYAIEQPEKVGANSMEPKAESELIEKRIGKRSSCGGLTLAVQSVAWPKSKSVYLVRFRVSVEKWTSYPNPLTFEPGDFELLQAGKSLPMESLHLEALSLSQDVPQIGGTAILQQGAFKGGIPLKLRFDPGFLSEKKRNCLEVAFSRATAKRLPVKK